MDMTEMLRERAEKSLAQIDSSYEAKHQRSMNSLNRQMTPTIMGLRLVGPPEPQLQDRHRELIRHSSADMMVGRCRFCNPDPHVFKCPVCDYETLDRWRMKLHNMADPQWCRDRGAKKARHWSRQA